MTPAKRDWIALSRAAIVAVAAITAVIAGGGTDLTGGALAAAPAAQPAGAPASAPAPAAQPATAVTKTAVPAAAAFDRMKALVGEWVDVDGTFGVKDQVAVSYRLTGAGTTVVESLFAGQPHEMITMYSRDGNDLVLTHYCAGGNQPRMRAKTMDGDVVRFDFDGGTNLDPAKDSHMHAAWFEFVSADEIRGEWIGWNGGKPSDHVLKFHLKRKQV